MDNNEKVLEYIRAKNAQKAKSDAIDDLSNSPEVKLNKLNSEYEKGKSICIDTILGKVYKDALPFDDPAKAASDDEARITMKKLINNRTDGKNSEYYIREAIKRTNSPTLKGILTEAEKMAKDWYQEKAADIKTANVSDLNFNPNVNPEELTQISKKLELDDIADIIQNNVQSTLSDESDKAKKEEEHNKKIEDILANDPNVVDNETMESALDRIDVFHNQVKVYQPSLFESILLNRTGLMKESTSTDVITEAIHEFTKLNVLKALRLESFDLNKIRDMSNEYLR